MNLVGASDIGQFPVTRTVCDGELALKSDTSFNTRMYRIIIISVVTFHAATLSVLDEISEIKYKIILVYNFK